MQTIEKRGVNPWAWQNALGYAQAVEVTSAQRTLYCAGQASIDADGKTAHSGDLRAQFTQALDNLEAVLTQSGYELSDVVRVNYYTTDVDGLFQNWDIHLTRLANAKLCPSSTLLGVSRLAYPDLLIEIEATAVK